MYICQNDLQSPVKTVIQQLNPKEFHELVLLLCSKAVNYKVESLVRN